MALQKSFENEAGQTGDYWRVDDIHMERAGMKMDVRLGLYKSKADRDGGKRPMNIAKNITFDIPAGSTTFSQLISGIYTQAKTAITSDQSEGDTPFFDGATDI